MKENECMCVCERMSNKAACDLLFVVPSSEHRIRLAWNHCSRESDVTENNHFEL